MLDLLRVSNPHQSDIPSNFNDAESIVRGIYSPFNLKKDNTLRNNFYQLRGDLDKGVSVLRLDYTSINDCKSHCKKIEKPAVKKEYYGLAKITAGDIIQSKVEPCSTELEHVPIDDFDAHAEIYYLIGGKLHIQPKGIPHPAPVLVVIDKLIEKTKAYIDPNPSADKWEGESI